MKTERRFKGAMSDEYAIIRQILPHFDELQRQVGQAVARVKRPSKAEPLKVLEIGCGDGITSVNILASHSNIILTALDNEEKMLKQARQKLKRDIAGKRCRLVRADALAYVKRLPSRSVDIVATAMTLHNMQQPYRARLHKQLYRVLKPGGLFVNADKYAPDNDAVRFEALKLAITRFFGTFIPRRKFDLLKDWVLHNVSDQGPDRVMKQQLTMRELRAIGFGGLRIVFRHNMEGVLVARKKK